jgi:DNA modification methylase
MKLFEFKSFLGNPAYEDENVLIYQGDSLRLMDRLPPEYLSLTITSPPYNIIPLLLIIGLAKHQEHEPKQQYYPN